MMKRIQNIINRSFAGGNVEHPPAGKRSSFTLVEMMVVLAIIFIIVGITLPVTNLVHRKVQEARREAMRQKIISALEDYRAVYGEYPINAADAEGTDRHYTDYYVIDPTGISPYTNINLISENTEPLTMPDGMQTEITTVEKMPFYGQAYEIDYSLSWPLSLKPRSQGKSPFIDVPDAAIVYVVWKVGSGDITPDGGIKGNWLQRPVIIDPLTLYQWSYFSDDGITYQLWITNNFSRITGALE